MVLNIDTIRALEVGKTYYLANSTGQIKKEADIANRFAVANADKIASTEAGGIAAKRIHAAVKDSIRSCLHREDWPEDAERYLERVAKPLVDHPPMKDAGGRHRVLDADAFEKPLADILDGASNVLVHVATSARIGMPHYDKVHLDHVFATFYAKKVAKGGARRRRITPICRRQACRTESKGDGDGLKRSVYV